MIKKNGNNEIKTLAHSNVQMSVSHSICTQVS